MAITLQGAWTLRVTARNAAFAQRFVVSGADVGNGAHDGVVGTSVFVRGTQWTLQVQHRPTRQGWHESSQRLGLPTVSEGVLRVDLASNDGGLDADYDDLVLGCSMPVGQSEHVVYGTVSRHASDTLFNPRRDDYLVVDAPTDVATLRRRHPGLRPVLDKLYPVPVPASTAGAGTELSPMLIPNGLPSVAVGLLFESRAVDPDGHEDEADAVRALGATVARVPFPAFTLRAGADALSRDELMAIAQIREQAIRQPCDTRPVAGATLRFQRYHRTRSEMAGEPYGGRGLREELGQTVTDEQGHYLFRFRQPWGGARPDLVVQVGGPGDTPCFETAPYDRVANLRRLDVCVPERVLGAIDPAQTAQVFEYIGPSSLTVVGPASGRCYQFHGPGASLVVDVRDCDTLSAIRSLRLRSA